MTLESQLYRILSADSGVSALVSARIYPLVIPQDVALPAIAYQRISGPRDHDQLGPTGLQEARMQFTVQASSYASAKAVSEAVRAALDGFGGKSGILATFLENEFDSDSDRLDSVTVRADYKLWYREA